MEKIRLYGKHAVGENSFALVDSDQFEYLSQWHWKAKPNGSRSGVYAVRNVLRDGKCITLRMHREVLGLSRKDSRDVDHINHCTLDNRRSNLRAVSRSDNLRNMKKVKVDVLCKYCGSAVSKVVMASSVGRVSSCGCSEVYAPRSAVYPARCEVCCKGFIARMRTRRFCSDACRCRAKYARHREKVLPDF